MLLTLPERGEIQYTLYLNDGRNGCYSGYSGSRNRMMNFSFMSDLKCRNPIQQFHAHKWIEIMATMFVTLSFIGINLRVYIDRQTLEMSYFAGKCS